MINISLVLRNFRVYPAFTDTRYVYVYYLCLYLKNIPRLSECNDNVTEVT